MNEAPCWSRSNFSIYFGENMNGLGMDYPRSWFATQEKAVSVAAAMLAAAKVLGPRATVSELIGATFAGEKVLVVGVMSASAYLGAVVGSIAVAIGRMAGCGSRLVDALEILARLRLNDPVITRHLMAHPEVLGTPGSRLPRSEVTVLAAPGARINEVQHGAE